MSLIINHNAMAQNVNRNLGTSYSALADSTRKLSSGLRIDRAADDAAGLAAREMMRSDVATIGQGIRNANDAISMVQTADGALGVIDEKLIRMKELAEQASTGTYNSDQRIIIDSEFQAMASEITRIASATDFNGIMLINGSMSGAHDGTTKASKGAIRVHFGTGNESTQDYYDIKIGNASAKGLGLATAKVDTQSGAETALKTLDSAIISKDNIRANLGSLQNRLDATVDNLTIQAENVQASESRISDVDVATEMTEFTRQQILTQTATAMLSQANSLPQLATRLVG